MENLRKMALGLVATGFILIVGCREFPPSDNQEDNDITINNNNNIEIGLPNDNSTEQTDIDLSNDSESDSQSDSILSLTQNPIVAQITQQVVEQRLISSKQFQRHHDLRFQHEKNKSSWVHLMA